METLYRIEHETGLGWYRSGVMDMLPSDLNRSIHDRHGDPTEWPDLYNDQQLQRIISVKGLDSHSFRFAYLSKDQVKRAITAKEFSALEALGCKIYEIVVSECHRSRFQAIFKETNVISKTPITYESLA